MQLLKPLTNLFPDHSKVPCVAMLLEVDSIVHLILLHREGGMVGSKIDVLKVDDMLKLLLRGLLHNCKFIGKSLDGVLIFEKAEVRLALIYHIIVLLDVDPLDLNLFQGALEGPIDRQQFQDRYYIR